MVSLAMKFLMKFTNIPVKVLTCKLGSLLILKCWSQGKLVTALLMAAVSAILKCQMFLSNGGGGGILKFTLQWIIWWWQYGSKDARVPKSRIRLGWSVMIRSAHEGFLLGSKLVCSEMIWDRPSEVNRFSISKPVIVVFPSGHQKWEWALKSPVKKTMQKGFQS